MSKESVELIRRNYELFQATGDFPSELIAPEFVWDMSNFRGWPEKKLYLGIDGAREFLREWLEAWDDWELALESLHDGGDRVVAIVRQHGKSKSTGLPIDLHGSPKREYPPAVGTTVHAPVAGRQTVG